MTRLLFFRHGDYADGWRALFERGEPETYRDQRATFLYEGGLAETHDITVLCIADRPHDVRLGPRLRSIGIDGATVEDAAAVAGILDAVAPQRIILRPRHRAVLEWAHRHRVPTLPTFAGAFPSGGLRTRWRNLRLARLLRAPVFPCVSNHSLNAARSVVQALHLPPERVIAWERRPLDMAPEIPRTAPDPAAPTAFFAGGLSEAKGVGDCLEAVRLLRDRGIALRFTFAGGGDLDFWRGRAEALGVADLARFAGLMPNAEVRAAMAASDMVVVASRASYPEGLPNTLCEALAARTPAVISDHPVFAERLRDGDTAAVFRGGDPASLADTVVRLVRDPALHGRLVSNAERAHAALYVGVERTRLIDMFLADPENRGGWVAPHSLAAQGLA